MQPYSPKIGAKPRIDRRIMVAALTYNRPEGLAALLDGLAALKLPQERVEFVIVDNSPDASARFLVLSRVARFPAPLYYRHEPKRGLSSARNNALDFALERADLMAFIDDDEVPQIYWLLNHLETINQTHCTASLGAVHAQFAAEPKEWMRRGGFQEVRRQKRHEILATGSTSNVLFDLASVRRLGLRFDEAFSRTGGEDTEFFDSLILEGGQILFTPQAIVTETIVPERATLTWLWQRWRRTGATDAKIRHKRKAGLQTSTRCIAGGVLRMGVGSALALVMLPASLVGRFDLCVKYLRIAARGLGFVEGAFGREIEEYRIVTR